MTGAALPSAHNLRKIALHFELPMDDLLWRHEEFARAYGTAAGAPAQSRFDMLRRKAFPGKISELKKYSGYYYVHSRLPQAPDKILRGIVQLYPEEGQVYSRSIERTVREDGRYYAKYQGTASLLNGFLFVVELETTAGDAVVETILRGSYRKRLDLLTGIAVGVTSRLQPYSSLIIWKFLGSVINIRQALSGCGLLDMNSLEIDPRVRRMLYATQATLVAP